MTKRPGKLTMKNRDGFTTLTATPLDTGARHVVLSIAGTHTALESAGAVEGLAKHLTHVAAWMRAQEQGAKIADQFEDIMTRFRDLATQGTA